MARRLSVTSIIRAFITGRHNMNAKELKNLILESIALIGINGLAFYFDAEYIPLAIGIDCTVLGIEIKSRLSK